MTDFDQAMRDWQARAVEPVLKKLPERQPSFATGSGVPVERLYGPDERDYCRSLGFPGQPPFTRGVQPTMYRGRLWTMRMFAGFGRPEDTNARFKYLLRAGQTGLSTAFDMPALMGFFAPKRSRITRA